MMFGDPDWIRTSGLKIRNLALYPPELRDHALGLVSQARGRRNSC